jgi:hypothetical protein
VGGFTGTHAECVIYLAGNTTSTATAADVTFSYNNFLSNSKQPTAASGLIWSNENPDPSYNHSVTFLNNSGICNLDAASIAGCSTVFAQSSATVGTLTYTSNYVDPTGTVASNSCVTTTSWRGIGSIPISGNIDMLTGGGAIKQVAITGGTHTSTTVTPTFASTTPFLTGSNSILLVTGATPAGWIPASWNGRFDSYTSLAFASTATSVSFNNTVNAASSGGTITDGALCAY